MNENKPLPPTAVVSLVNGILFICLGILVIPGIICGIVGLNKAKQGYQSVDNNPDMYGGIGMLKAGRITSIIGIVYSIASIFFWVLYSILIVSLLNY